MKGNQQDLVINWNEVLERRDQGLSHVPGMNYFGPFTADSIKEIFRDFNFRNVSLEVPLKITKWIFPLGGAAVLGTWLKLRRRVGLEPQSSGSWLQFRSEISPRPMC